MVLLQEIEYLGHSSFLRYFSLLMSFFLKAMYLGADMFVGIMPKIQTEWGKCKPQVHKGSTRLWYSDSSSSLDKIKDYPSGFDVTVFMFNKLHIANWQLSVFVISFCMFVCCHCLSRKQYCCIFFTYLKYSCSRLN